MNKCPKCGSKNCTSNYTSSGVGHYLFDAIRAIFFNNNGNTNEDLMMSAIENKPQISKHHKCLDCGYKW